MVPPPILIDKYGRPLKICLTRDVASAHMTRLIQELGGIATENERDASVVLAAPDRKYAEQMYSIDWLQHCYNAKRLLPYDTDTYRLERSQRLFKRHFTNQDDNQLRAFIQRKRETSGRLFLNGNAIYQEMEREYPQHTWQAWRERALKDLHLDQGPSLYELNKIRRQQAIDAQAARSAAIQQQQLQQPHDGKGGSRGGAGAAPLSISSGSSSSLNDQYASHHKEQGHMEVGEDEADLPQYQTQEPTNALEISDEDDQDLNPPSSLTAHTRASTSATTVMDTGGEVHRQPSVGAHRLASIHLHGRRFGIRNIPATFVRRADRLGAAASTAVADAQTMESRAQQPQHHQPPQDQSHERQSQQREGSARRSSTQLDGVCTQAQSQPLDHSQSQSQGSARRSVPAPEDNEAWLHFVSQVQETPPMDRVVATPSYHQDWNSASQRHLPWLDSKDASSSSLMSEDDVYQAYHRNDSLPINSDRNADKEGSQVYQPFQQESLRIPSSLDLSPVAPAAATTTTLSTTPRQIPSFDDQATENTLTRFMEIKQSFARPLLGHGDAGHMSDEEEHSRRWSNASFRYPAQQSRLDHHRHEAMRTRSARSQSPSHNHYSISHSSRRDHTASEVAANAGSSTSSGTGGARTMTTDKLASTLIPSSLSAGSASSERYWSITDSFLDDDNGDEGGRRWSSASFFRYNRVQQQQRNDEYQNTVSTRPPARSQSPSAVPHITINHSQSIQPNPRPEQEPLQAANSQNSKNVPARLFAMPVAPRSLRKESTLPPVKTPRVTVSTTPPSPPIPRKTSALQQQQQQRRAEEDGLVTGVRDLEDTLLQPVQDEDEQDDELLIRHRTKPNTVITAVAPAPVAPAVGTQSIGDPKPSKVDNTSAVPSDDHAAPRESLFPQTLFYNLAGRESHGDSGEHHNNGDDLNNNADHTTLADERKRRQLQEKEQLWRFLEHKFRSEIDELLTVELLTGDEALDLLDACSGDLQLAKLYIRGEMPDHKQGDIWTRDDDRVLMYMREDADQKELEKAHTTVQCTKRSRYLTRTRTEAKLWKPEAEARLQHQDYVRNGSAGIGSAGPKIFDDRQDRYGRTQSPVSVRNEQHSYHYTANGRHLNASQSRSSSVVSVSSNRLKRMAPESANDASDIKGKRRAY